jgi:uncharacterized protein (TIGR00661 family)
MKYLFLVQGEGRGHMTQAISLLSVLKENNHEVVGVLLGKNPRRQIPGYVYKSIDTFIDGYDSPNFVFNKSNKGILITRSLVYNLLRIPRYIKSLRMINSIVKKTNPDVIINFYDLLGGVYNYFFPGKIFICIGHQFLITHPDTPVPKGKKIDNKLLRLHNKVASLKAWKCLALSFRQMKGFRAKNIFVVPPLLRKEILQTDTGQIKEDGYLHGYILNEGFAAEIIRWHKGNPALHANIFWDKGGAEKTMAVNENLVFHQIDDTLFLEYFKNCSMYAGTAGFESLCEAMYLGKPFLCVPSENHYEQLYNALDATLDGAGIWDTSFDLDKLLDFRDNYKFNAEDFRRWTNTAPEVFLEHLAGNNTAKEDTTHVPGRGRHYNND